MTELKKRDETLLVKVEIEFIVDCTCAGKNYTKGDKITVTKGQAGLYKNRKIVK